jgi:siroheme synthase
MSKVVSFKLSDEEYEALAALQSEGEVSPSITAKRIVKDALGLPVTGLSTPVDSQIDERIQQAIAPLKAQVEELSRSLATLGEAAA